MTNGWNEGLETAAALADAADASNPDAGFSDLALLIRALRTGSPVAEPVDPGEMVAWGLLGQGSDFGRVVDTTIFKRRADKWREQAADRVVPLFLAPPAPAVGSPGQVRVTDAMVERAEAAFYKRHERGFLMKPLINPGDMRAALQAALPDPKPAETEPKDA